MGLVTPGPPEPDRPGGGPEDDGLTQTRPAVPVTIAITRRADPERASEMIASFPLSLTATLVTGRLLAGVAVGFRTLLITLCLTPLMTYPVLPWITRTLHWWLHGMPAPWRRPR